MTEVWRPAADWELKSMIAQHAEARQPVEIVGAGTKRAMGRPIVPATVISLATIRGVTLYEPTELVMSARAGTPVSQIEVELAARGQMLPFEPIDLGPALGTPVGAQTIGSVFATNNSGPRRIAFGSARDHLIGVRGVNGRGELFKSGGRVIKNVTGYDVARGLTNSWGTLAVLTEVTFKVAPLPDDVATLVYRGLPDELAVELMTQAIATPFEPSAVMHLAGGHAGRLRTSIPGGNAAPLTIVRIENFVKSVLYRKDRLKQTLKAYGEPIELDLDQSLQLWGEIRRMAFLPHSPSMVWRISTSPKAAPALIANIRRHMQLEVTLDWAGGMLWLETPPSADAGAADIRRAVANFGGHATLIRAPAAVRGTVDVFQPLSPGVERLTLGMKQAFDPDGVLNPGRMYAAF